MPLYERAIYAVPLLGWMLKDVIHGDRANKWWFLLALVSTWGMGILAFGVPALVVPVVAVVPGIVLLIVLLTRG